MGKKPNFQAASAMVGVADLHHRARAACFLHPDLGPGWDPGSSLKFERLHRIELDGLNMVKDEIIYEHDSSEGYTFSNPNKPPDVHQDMNMEELKLKKQADVLLKKANK